MASVALLACVVATLTACGSSQPIPRVSAAPPPTPSLLPSGPTTATVEPTANCGSDGTGASDAILNIWTLDSVEEIDLETASGLPTVAPAATQDPAEIPVVGSVLGATDVRTVLFAAGTVAEPPSISSLTADFVPFGSINVISVGAAVDGATVLLRLPDGDARGVLRVAIEWTSACGSAAAVGEIALRVFDPSVAANCPTSEEELVESVTSLADASFLFGTVEVPLAVVSWSARWLFASGVTDRPQFEPWDRKAIIEAASGASVVVRDAVEGLQLLSVRTWIYERDVVEAYLEPDSTTELSTYGSDRTNANSLGRVRIPTPLEAGSYVFESQGTWQTSCLNLVTYNAVSVEVR